MCRLRHKENEELSKLETQQKNIPFYEPAKTEKVPVNEEVFVLQNASASVQKMQLGERYDVFYVTSAAQN